ncbi:transposase family protein [Actinomadura alba]|uniref:DDE Tnp4 domain-containing protein n=1 Tax=Actinomadura alba TaxID=406431 RepID=A0ABR7LTV0_9ACTN|nr:transposase family protein [Actinomadura alba]MBC6468271.1 hypothetical protein [Actinomadura alba]
MLAARAPDLHRALERATADGLPHLILDGKIFDSDRCRIKTVSVKGETIDAWYPGKTHDFGANVQALFEPGGLPIWTSDGEPGGVVDIEAARRHVFPAAYPATNTMPILADPGQPDTPQVTRPHARRLHAERTGCPVRANPAKLGLQWLISTLADVREEWLCIPGAR